MGINEYKNMVEKMNIPENMDRELKNNLFLNQKEKKQMKHTKRIKRITAAAITAILILGISQTSVVSNAAATIMHYFRYGFSFTEEDGTKKSVNMNTEYLRLSDNAPLEEKIMHSVDEVSDSIGIPLLNTSDEYKGKVTYIPSLSDPNRLIGITVRNHFYYMGDITDIKQDKEQNVISYQNGKTYFTPISVQIAVRTDENLTEKYQDNELGFVSENHYVALDDVSSDSEVYEIPSLGIKAVLFTVRTDGPMDWGLDHEIDCTSAVFVYKGVEYVYLGGVSHDTMKTFLTTLKN